MSLRTLLLEISLLFCLGNCWADHVTYLRAPIGAQPTVWTGVENGSLCVHAAVPSWQQLDTWMLAWRGFRTICRGDLISHPSTSAGVDWCYAGDTSVTCSADEPVPSGMLHAAERLGVSSCSQAPCVLHQLLRGSDD